MRGKAHAGIVEIPCGGAPALLRPGPRLLVLSSEERTISYDLEGRPRGGWEGGRGWRRGLDGSVLISSRERGESIHRRAGPRSVAARSRCRWARSWASRAARRLRGGGRADLAELLAAAAEGRDGEKDRAAFARVYDPVPILPPGEYAAVLLQFSRGCSWNRCGFCSFYRSREHRLLAPVEAEAHALAVRDLLARGSSARRGVFLGDAAAVSAPTDAVEGWLSIAGEVFPRHAAEGVASFVDLAAVRRRRGDAWRRLRRAGLNRLYAGLETGDEELRRRLGKRGRPGELVAAARSVREAGIELVPILLAGRERGLDAPAHLAASLDWLRAVDALGRQTVLVSPLDASGDGPVDDRWRQARRTARVLEEALRRAGVGRVALYDITRSIY